MDIAHRFAAGESFDEFLAGIQNLRPFWEGAVRRARVAPEMIARLRALPGRWHLLVLNADWCRDSVNNVPYLAALVSGAPNVQMRLFDRDANLDLMDTHLTGKSRSIPKVIVYDDSFNDCGVWGPRPAELQKWVVEEGLPLPKDQRYKKIRAWYAQDDGRTTVSEIVEMLERCPAGGGARRGNGQAHD